MLLDFLLQLVTDIWKKASLRIKKASPGKRLRWNYIYCYIIDLNFTIAVTCLKTAIFQSYFGGTSGFVDFNKLKLHSDLHLKLITQTLIKTRKYSNIFQVFIIFFIIILLKVFWVVLKINNVRSSQKELFWKVTSMYIK